MASIVKAKDLKFTNVNNTKRGYLDALANMRPGDAMVIKNRMASTAIGLANRVCPDRVWRTRTASDGKLYVVCEAK